MSTTETSEFAVPEVVADEKEESKEIKATKRPAEVSRRTTKKINDFFCLFSLRLLMIIFVLPHIQICGIC